MDLGEDRLSIAIHTDRPRLANESAADSWSSDPLTRDRTSVAKSEGIEFAKLRIS